MSQQHIPVNPRCYKDALQQFDQTFTYHEHINLQFSQQDSYKICEKLGYGKYSDVFKGFKDDSDEPIVIKVLKPVKYVKVYREVKILTNLLGGPHIMALKDMTKVKNSDYPAFITEFSGASLQSLLTQYALSSSMLRLFMGQLFLALDYCHQHGIIHRDVKGGNICANLDTRRLTLLDFGLAEFYSGKALHHRVATRHYKSPELLVNYQLYDYSLDIWSAATMLAGYIFKIQPFFRGSDNNNQLDKIVEVLGSENLFKMCEKYNVDIGTTRKRQLSNFKERQLEEFVNDENQSLADQEVVQLLKACLQYDPESRPTAKECLQFPYFKSILKELADIQIQQFLEIEKIIQDNFVNVPDCILMSVKSQNNNWPIPISPNEILGQNIFDQDRWTTGWQKWQAGLCEKGSIQLNQQQTGE
ncbi:Kinase, CMGC CK2 [Spironucleus salmonicida]|uniref:non-specific serine/threonine protein kinase n=1 Tax=Spironucleus salmonicida TaxID=348837 RepID=V6LX00_9EUKA|nr:Kinase, CMGC CK2 [Spironucleus salmonicida]|eukprot:EST48231.1 Kinase, CMGC CK2 [Spironucleus salmonicida]